MMTAATEGNRSMNEKKHNAPPAKHPLREPSIAQGDVVLLGGPAMAYNEGWIKLHRSVRDSVLWKKPLSRMDAWIDLIMTARWLDKPSTVLVGATQRISCERGELITSQEALAKQWGWSRSKVKRFIDALEADQMVNTNSTHNSTKITICNYDTYQDARTPIEQQSSGNRAAIEQQSSSNRTHNKKDKNERREEHTPARAGEDKPEFELPESVEEIKPGDWEYKEQRRKDKELISTSQVYQLANHWATRHAIQPSPMMRDNFKALLAAGISTKFIQKYINFSKVSDKPWEFRDRVIEAHRNAKTYPTPEEVLAKRGQL
jgi:hypothetical protein